MGETAPLCARIAAIARNDPARAALADGTRSATYGELWSQASRFAAWLRGNGVVAGDRVALVLANGIEAAAACYGAWLAGLLYAYVGLLIGALAAVRSLPGALGTAAHGADVSRAGLSATRWPGRMERLWPRDALQATAVWARIDGDGDGDGGGSNLDGHAAPPLPEVWLDGAHNPQGAGVLADLLGTLRRGRPLTVVLGVVGDKAAAEMAAPLALATQVVLTEPPSPRALPAAGLREALDGHLPAAVWVEPDCYAALRHALRVSPPGGMLVVYGSLFLVGAIRARWLGETVDAIALQDPRAVRATGATHRRENQ
mgnify:CR=1 FL=1